VTIGLRDNMEQTYKSNEVRVPRSGIARATARLEFERRLARSYRQIVAARARVEQMSELSDPIEDLRERGDVDDPNLPMARLARRFGFSPPEIDLIWCVVACSVDGRDVPHLEALGGGHVRRGLSLAVYALLTGVPDVSNHAIAYLAHWLAAPNPMVETGLLRAIEAASPAARAYVASSRLVSFLIGDDPALEPLRRVTVPDDVLYDDRQTVTLPDLRAAVDGGAVVVIEGPDGSGRATAAARAVGTAVLVLDFRQLAVEHTADALVALRRECLLRGEPPLLANVDLALAEDARELRRQVGAFIDHTSGPIIVTATAPGCDLGGTRPQVRITWPIAETSCRAAQWVRAIEATGRMADGDLLELAGRYRVGPAAIRRAVVSAQMRGDRSAVVGAAALAAGLRHNIAEQLGSLAQRVDVNQTWKDLVIADDTSDLISALVSRVRHAHQVLERWGYRHKIARGGGVAALFSGPPGTGKTMVAGLIARELDLELYQVDLSKVISKWVGETEKNLSRLFDGAEAGHALLLFDEADSLFAQRSAQVSTANDRYANLEVNYLLQRVEAFGGIAILTTNMDTAIDSALRRRLAAHVVFAIPEEEERAQLWRRQLVTGTAPLAGDISYDELARGYPAMSGANIRNAAISGAYLAAAAGAPEITQDHLTRACRAEYRSMGHMVREVMTPRASRQPRRI
jgi:hypothetical protein